MHTTREILMAVVQLASVSRSSEPRVRMFGKFLIDGGPVLNAPKPRTIMALMLLYAGRLVSREELIYEVWGDRPPKTCVVTTQTYLYHIRNQTNIEVFSSGLAYGFNVRKEEVDAHLFQQFINQGKTAMRQNQLEEAKRLLGRARSLHEDRSFLLDVECGSSLASWSLKISDMRQTAQLSWMQLAIKEGRHADILDDLRAFWRRDPLAEDVASLLMLALYRMPRVKAALEVYTSTCDMLREELGIYPSHMLQELHAKILQGSSELLEANYLP